MPLQNIPNDVNVQGHFSAQTMDVPAASIGDAQVKSNAAIQVTKLQHLHRAHFADPILTLATTKTLPLFIASGIATVRQVKFGVYTAPVTGSETVTFDLKKNGVSILSATVNFSSADSDRDVKLGTLSSTALVAGDWLTGEAVIAGTGGTQAIGIAMWVEVDEAAN